MNKRFRLWYNLASYFLLLSAITHATGHYLFYLDESGFASDRVALAEAMKGYLADTFILNTSMWTLLKMFSLSFSLLFLFAGLINLLLIRSNLPADAMKRVAKFHLLFWLASLLLFLSLHPAIQPIVICATASSLFAIALTQAKDDA